MLKIKHNRKNSIIIFSIIIVVIFSIIFWTVSIIRKIDEENYLKNRDEVVSLCSELFDGDKVVLDKTSEEDLDNCEERLSKFGEDDEANALRNEVENAMMYLTWMDSINEFVDINDIVLESIKQEDVDLLKGEIEKLAEQYQKLAEERLKYLQDNLNAMNDAKNAVAGLFKSSDLKDVKSGVKRKDYENAKGKVDKLKQEELKKSFEEPLKRVFEYVEKEEKIERERAEAARKAAEERRKKIAASWHRLNISPYYINQVSEKYLNGCEAASLLMAMKYKGYIRGTSFKTFADEMPRSDNPNEGFFSDMKTLEPKEVGAHWIAPAPLAAYGRSRGGNVIDVTGWSLDRLDEEVKNGNPVVIYLTWSFKDPGKKVNGVPTNLHVVVLSGYNSYTGDQEFYDPWPSLGKNPSLSKARTQKLYKASGYRAVVIR